MQKVLLEVTSGKKSATFFCFSRGVTSQKSTDIRDWKLPTEEYIHSTDITAPGCVSEFEI